MDENRIGNGFVGMLTTGARFVALALCLLLAAILGCSGDAPSRPFDGKVWKESVAARPAMIKGLQIHLKPGLSRSEVISMLGEPDRVLQASEVESSSASGEYLYYKLPLSEAAFDVSQFVIEIDGFGKLRNSFLFDN